MRVRRAAALAALALVVGVTSASGCSFGFVSTQIAGRDESGQLVVAAVDCDGTDPEVDGLTVQLTGPETTSTWVLAEPGAGPVVPASRPEQVGPPPQADPEALVHGATAIDLIPVGHPAPAGWVVAQPLTAPASGEEAAVVTVSTEYDGTTMLTVPGGGEADRYQAEIGGTSYTDITGSELAARVDEECHGDDLDGGTFALVLGIGAVVIAVPTLIGIVVAVRQYGRAGRRDR